MGSLSKCTWSVSSRNGLSSLEWGGLSLSSVCDALMSGKHLDSFSGLSWGCPGLVAHWPWGTLSLCFPRAASMPFGSLSLTCYYPETPDKLFFFKYTPGPLLTPKCTCLYFFVEMVFSFDGGSSDGQEINSSSRTRSWSNKGENHSSPASILLETIGLWT